MQGQLDLAFQTATVEIRRAGQVDPLRRKGIDNRAKLAEHATGFRRVGEPETPLGMQQIQMDAGQRIGNQSRNVGQQSRQALAQPRGKPASGSFFPFRQHLCRSRGRFLSVRPAARCQREQRRQARAKEAQLQTDRRRAA